VVEDLRVAAAGGEPLAAAPAAAAAAAVPGQGGDARAVAGEVPHLHGGRRVREREREWREGESSEREREGPVRSRTYLEDEE
jgi:hypothetical protein